MVCAEILGLGKRLLQQLAEWLVSDDVGVEDAGCGGPGLVWLHVVCLLNVLPNFLKHLCRCLMVEK